jgi:hypothetical protein
MSGRSTSDIVTPMLRQAVGLARLHDFLAEFPADERVKWIAAFKDGGTVTPEEADMLIECSGREIA